MVMETTASKLAKLQEKFSSLRKVEIHEPSDAPFPLISLLTLYAKSPLELYMNYFEGFRLLANFLSPIDIPKIENNKPVPSPLNNYEIQEIARILKCNQRVIYDTLKKIYNE